MKCFYLPGAPLNLTYDKALTERCVNDGATLTDVQPYRSQEGKLREVDFCQLNASRASAGQLHIDIITKIIIVVTIAIVCHCACNSSLYFFTPLCFFSSSLIPLPACFCEQMTHTPLCISHSVSF